MEAPRLFVYGTLQPGGPNAHVLEPYPGQWFRATVRGSLRSAGWGDAQGYPGLDLAPAGGGAGEVEGFVLQAQALAEAWPTLDAFEGDGYQRVRTWATLEDGSEVQVEVYVLQPGP